jgi:hypothetical protein
MSSTLSKILSLFCNLFNGSKTNGCNVFFAIELAFETTLLAVFTTDSALETTLPATLPATLLATLLAVVTTEPAPETTLPATLLAVAAELAAVSTIEVTAEFLLYQITNLLIALDLLIFCAVSFHIYLPSKGAISTIR